MGSKNQKSPTIQKKEHCCVVYIVCIHVRTILNVSNALLGEKIHCKCIQWTVAFIWFLHIDETTNLWKDPVICACILWPYYGYYISLQKIGRIRYSKLAFPSNVSSVQWTTSCQQGFKASWRPFLGQKHAKSHSGDHMHSFGFHCIDVMDTYILTCSSVRYRRQEGS